MITKVKKLQLMISVEESRRDKNGCKKEENKEETKEENNKENS